MPKEIPPKNYGEFIKRAAEASRAQAKPGDTDSVLSARQEFAKLQKDATIRQLAGLELPKNLP